MVIEIDKDIIKFMNHANGMFTAELNDTRYTYFREAYTIWNERFEKGSLIADKINVRGINIKEFRILDNMKAWEACLFLLENDLGVISSDGYLLNGVDGAKNILKKGLDKTYEVYIKEGN